MIETLAIVMGILHVLPWAIVAFTDKYADWDLRLMFLLAAAILGILVWMIILVLPGAILLFFITAIYSWRTLPLNKRN